ncbi:hypothetical protein CH282_15290 [Rhodococcus sp. 06-418-1B]|nr:phage tail tape measure protein [Rhodococcus sp. 06-418-1B]OZC84499.1 hypothetical protein CH282_15290 [Rhodococcus sp. 06-418-1B]
MSLDTGTIYTRLELDDVRFNRGLETAERNARTLSTTLDRSTNSMRNSLREPTTQLGRLETAASGASTEIRQLDQVPSGLQSSARRAAQEVDSITGSAERAGRGLRDNLGGEAGGDAGGRFLSGFSGALEGISSRSGPIAGSILGIATLGLGVGVALAAAIKDGMSQELARDLFQAQTGTTVAQAEKFARAAGEAYADVFGESVEANLSTLKLALQNNIIDPGATQRDAQAVVGQLETISAALDSEVTDSVNAVSALMSTGLATSAEEASDMIANAVGGSANKGGDLLEVLTEYSVGWKNAGISAEQALALIEQSTDAGVWNADVAGDALREFGRRVSEEGDTIVTTLNDIGLNGDALFQAFKEGGPAANAAFDEAFDAISKIEDPVERNTAAMGLLGDTAGDFIGVLSKWDPSKALNDFGEFEGAAGRLANTMGGNAATSVEGAMRSIEVVADGLKASLAEAFGPQIAEWADNISNNRAGVVEFFIGIGDAGFEAAKAVASFVADGMRLLGDFAGSAAETGASFLDMGANILSVGESIPGFGAVLGIATGGAAEKLRDLADATRNGGESIESALTKGADVIDGTLIPGIDSAQERFNQFAGDMKLSAAFNDESAKVSAAIADIGVQADGTKMNLEGFTGAANEMVPPGLADSIRGVADGLEAQVRTGIEAGNTVESLTGQYASNRDMLLQQLAASGMSNKAANDYITTLGLTPELVNTLIEQEGMPEAQYALDVLKGKVVDVPDDKTIVTEALTKDATDALSALGLKVETLPDGTTRITANTDDGQIAIDNFLRNNDGKSLQMYVELEQRRVGYWQSQGVSAADAPGMQGPVPVALPSGGGGSPGGGGGGFADGGAIHGPGGPRDDLIPLWGSAGEHMFDAEDVKAMGGQQAVYEFRRNLHNGAGKYADGGAIGNREAAVSFAQSKNGMAYEYGKLDCSGYWSEIVNQYAGTNFRFTTDSDFAALGFQPGYQEGGINIGTNGGVGMNGHMAGTLFGTNAESRSDGIFYGGSAQGAQDFPMVWHWPTGDDPSTEALGIGSATGGAGGSATPSDSSGGTSTGARGGDVRDVFVTNWPTGSGSGSTSGGSAPRPSGTGGGSAGGTPQSSGQDPAVGGIIGELNKAFAQFAETEHTGLAALAGGQFTPRLREVMGLEESHPLVAGALGKIPPTDIVPAMLTLGEEVIPKDMAEKHRGLLELIRKDAVGAYADGGTVGFFGPKDRAFEAGGSKHPETVRQWASAQSDSDAIGSGTPLTVLKQATSGELAAENMYKTLVGAAGLAGFLAGEFESLLSGGVLNLGRETVEQLREAFQSAAESLPPTGDTIQGDQINGDIVSQQSNDPGAVIRNAAGAFGLRL